MAEIVVIGAGMSGLAAASRLATLGHRVTVYEAGPTYGGMVGRYERDGFAFDTGPGLLSLPAVYRDLALKTGREPLEQLVELRPVAPESRHLFPDGTDLTLPNASRGGVAQALDAAFGAGSGARWSEVMNHGRAVWEATRRPLLEEPLPTEGGVLAPADLDRLDTDPYPLRPRTGLARLRRPVPWTLATVAARQLGGHPGLTALLDEPALRYGLVPGQAPAGAAVLAYMEQSFGVWYVRGGMRALAEAFFRRCELRGVEFRFDTPVTRVIVEEGRARGVETARGRVDADLVVSAMDTDALFRNGLAEWPGVPAEGWEPVEVPGRFSVLLALRGPRPEGTVHRTVVHAADPAAEENALTHNAPPCERPTVQVLRPDDPTLRPDDAHESVVLTATVPAQDEVDWTVPGFAERYADRLLDHVDAAGLGLRERVLWRVVRTPEDTRRETGSVYGAVAGPTLAGSHHPTAGIKAANESPVPGLYLVGGGAHPGGGLARVGMSACITAGLIGPA
ncbi:phytoene desaturase family protein [Kitasatospora sp. NPDC101183]|uniref:phytoene desaturase family protein n=1 Tax=Kitasatospora sp. NPDC101183 TaxID=3364100 RepID=UPI003808FE1E